MIPDELNVYATTAANAEESSWGTYCPGMSPMPPAEFDTCLGDLYSVAWMENRCPPPSLPPHPPPPPPPPPPHTAVGIARFMRIWPPVCGSDAGMFCLCSYHPPPPGGRAQALPLPLPLSYTYQMLSQIVAVNLWQHLVMRYDAIFVKTFDRVTSVVDRELGTGRHL